MLIEFLKSDKRLQVYIEQDCIPEEWERDIANKRMKSQHAETVLRMMRRNARIAEAAMDNLAEEGYIRPHFKDILRMLHG